MRRERDDAHQPIDGLAVPAADLEGEPQVAKHGRVIRSRGRGLFQEPDRMRDLSARARHESERMQRRGASGGFLNDSAIRGFGLAVSPGADVRLGLGQPAR
jgi:hypothetical protein